MQQNTFIKLLAGLVGLFLSIKWMIYEYKFITMMLYADENISWLLEIPLMLFFAFMLIVSLSLFIGSIMDFEPRKLLGEVSLKRSIVLALIFNIILMSLAYINAYTKIINQTVSIVIVFMLLLLIYIFGARKHNITPIFFLVSTFVVSGIIWGILFVVF